VPQHLTTHLQVLQFTLEPGAPRLCRLHPPLGSLTAGLCSRQRHGECGSVGDRCGCDGIGSIGRHACRQPHEQTSPAQPPAPPKLSIPTCIQAAVLCHPQHLPLPLLRLCHTVPLLLQLALGCIPRKVGILLRLRQLSLQPRHVHLQLADLLLQTSTAATAAAAG
jgi:hypothetical protein